MGQEKGTGAAMAMAPIINVRTRETDGVVAVARQYPSVLDNLAAALPNLLTYLGIASLLGVFGSLLLARRVKRQTLGLEPREITGLVEQREALLHGIREGLVAIDLDRRITLVNDEAVAPSRHPPDLHGPAGQRRRRGRPCSPAIFEGTERSPTGSSPSKDGS